MELMSLVLAMANGAVAALNCVTWAETHEARDAIASVAWFGSMAYWLFRGALPI